MSAIPKSGRLCKLSNGFFGPKWTDKWVHLDGHTLKYFSMGTQQHSLFSSSSARKSTAIDLAAYSFELREDKRITRKYAFHLVPAHKASKLYVFACGSDMELQEWRQAFQCAQACESPIIQPIGSSFVTKHTRLAQDALTSLQLHGATRIDTAKLRLLLQSIGGRGMLVYIGWKGTESEFVMIQQRLDPSASSKCLQDRFAIVMQHYYIAQEAMMKCASLKNESSTDLRCPPRASNISEISNIEDEVSARESCHGNTLSTDCSPSDNNDFRHASRTSLLPAPVIVPNQTRSLPTSHEIEYDEVADENQEPVNWSTEYGHLMAMDMRFSDPLAHGLQISSFLMNFRLFSEDVVKQVVQELGLDSNLKSIPTISMCDDKFLTAGMHPGDKNPAAIGIAKFKKDGVLVYINIENPQTNEQQSVVLNKQLGNEIRVARLLHETFRKNESLNMSSLIKIPLQCVVDFLGFRALVIALSSRDATKVECSRCAESVDKNIWGNASIQLKKAFDGMGLLTDSLQPSSARNNPTEVAEIHKLPPYVSQTTGVANDGNMVTIFNLRDTMPADLVEVEQGSSGPNAFHTNKFRPEFVAWHGNMLPLHSNAHVTRSDSALSLESQLLRQAAASASEHLRLEVIPDFISNLEENEAHVYDSLSITQALHIAGINVRYLGLCFDAASLKHIRQLLLVEMIARACKVELRKSLRMITMDAVHDSNRFAISFDQSNKAHQEAAQPQDEDSNGLAEHGQFESGFALASLKPLVAETVQTLAQKVILEFFNLVFSSGSGDCRTIWLERIIPRMINMFDRHPEDSQYRFDDLLNDGAVHWPQLFLAVQYHTHVSFEDSMVINFNSPCPLAEEMLVRVEPISTLLARTSPTCEIRLQELDDSVAQGHVDEAITMIQFHLAILDTAPRDERSTSLTRLLIGLSELYDQCENTCADGEGYQKKAEEYARLALEASPRNHIDHARAGMLLLRLRQRGQPEFSIADAIDAFEQAIAVAKWHLGDTHPAFFDMYMTMMEISHASRDMEATFHYFAEAAAVLKECFGRFNVKYAEIKRKQGEALFVEGRVDEAIGILEEAMAVYDRLCCTRADDRTEVSELQLCYASCGYMLAALQATEGNPAAYETAYRSALSAYKLRKDLLPIDDSNLLASMLQLGELASELGDWYRAMEYYRPTLQQLKMQHQKDDDGVAQVRTLTQTVVRLHIRHLPEEKRAIIKNTEKNYTETIDSFAVANNVDAATSDDSDCHLSREQELLSFVVHKLLVTDPVSYIDELIESTIYELDAYRYQSFSSMHSPRRPSNKAMLSFDSSSSLASPRHSGSQSNSDLGPRVISLPSATSAFPSAAEAVASPSRGQKFMSFDLPPRNILVTASGEFTSGAQLAALLHLESLPH